MRTYSGEERTCELESPEGKPVPVMCGRFRCVMASSDRQPLNEVVFLTVAEVASVMRVSKMTVYRLVHSGHLPAIRVGRSFRVPEQAVHDYLRESYVGVESA
jgi:excisionase family DNA binding protein